MFPHVREKVYLCSAFGTDVARMIRYIYIVLGLLAVGLGGTWRGGAGVADDAVPAAGVMAVLPLVAASAAVAATVVAG